MNLIETSTYVSTALRKTLKYPRYYNRFRTIHNILVKISYPYIFLIAILGFITNTSTVILLSKNFITKNSRNKCTLISLALSDLIFNIALFIRGFHDIIKGHSDRLCLIISFLSNLAELLSASYTVAFTIQRYAAVRYPLETAAHRRSSPIISLVLIFIFGTIFCVTLTYNNIYVDCHEELELTWFIADACISFVIPFSIIFTCNVLIISFIRHRSFSPISMQSILMRSRRNLASCSKKLHKDGLTETDNNTVTNGNGTYTNTDENLSAMTSLRRKDRLSSFSSEIGPQPRPSSISLLFDRIHASKSLSDSQFHSGFRPFVLSELATRFKRRSSCDSASYRRSKRSSFQFNDPEYFATISARTCQSMRVTRMLILVSTCFLILNAPAHLCIIALKIYTNINTPILSNGIEIYIPEPINNLTGCEIKYFFSNSSLHRHTNNNTIVSLSKIDGIMEDQMAIHLFYVAIILTQCLAYASYSINFFLYSFSGMAFRASLKQLVDTVRRH